jgi:hypothetical protein
MHIVRIASDCFKELTLEFISENNTLETSNV